MSSLKVGFLMAVISFSQVAGTAGRELLPPPQNVTVWSKDFNLYLTWLPPDGVSTQVSYTVEWMDHFDLKWKNVASCTDISETVCNITCVSPDLYNRYSIQVRAETRTNTGIKSSAWVEVENIDYNKQVELGPPELQLKMIGDTLQLKTPFSYPACMEVLSSHLTSEVEYWTDGSKKKVNFGGPKDIDISQFGAGKYCFQARTYFSITEKRSRFSEPECRVFHEKGNWESGAFLLLLLLVFPPGSFAVFCWYKTIPKGVKIPQTLDFSGYKGPKKLLEYSKRDIIKVDSIICAEVLVAPRRKSGSGLQVCSLPSSVHSTLEDEDEDEDEDFIPYTERLQFQKKSTNGSMVSMVHNLSESTSASGSSQEHNGCLPDFTVLEHLLLTEPMTEQSMSKLQASLGSSFSESSSMEETLEFNISSLAAEGDGQEVVAVEIDPFLQLFGNHLMDSRSSSEDGCGKLHGSLLGDQDHCEPNGLIFEEVLIDGRGSEFISRTSGSFMVDMPLLKESAVQSLENELQGENQGLELDRTLEPKFHGYISRS